MSTGQSQTLEHFIGPSEDTEFFFHGAKTSTRLFADHTVLMLPDNSTDLNPTETRCRMQNCRQAEGFMVMEDVQKLRNIIFERLWEVFE